MNTFLTLLAICCISTSSFSAETAKSNLKILSGTPTQKGDLLTTADQAAKLELPSSHTIIELLPHSELKLATHEDPETVELNSGMARAHIQKLLSGDRSKVKFLLKSKAATMGVRGTDFLAVVTPILGESEIVVFEGNVDFTSATDSNDVKHIPAGYWGGVGGRFGSKTHELIKLPPEALKHFDEVSQVK